MTRLYGFTYNWVNRFAVGFGKRCLCICMFPQKRIEIYFYITTSQSVMFNTKYNCDKFRFFGFASIDKEDLMDE